MPRENNHAQLEAFKGKVAQLQNQTDALSFRIILPWLCVCLPLCLSLLHAAADFFFLLLIFEFRKHNIGTKISEQPHTKKQTLELDQSKQKKEQKDNYRGGKNMKTN